METSHSEDTRRIARNTVFLYIRSLFNLFLSLFTSRFVLQTLGADDYGLYNVVGGFVSMFWVVSASITSSVQRFLNYEMGLGDKGRPDKVFQTSLFLMLMLSLIVFLPLETFGLWYLNNRMVFLPERVFAANVVFQLSIITSVVNILCSPFDSSVVAYEKMRVYSFTGITETVLLFLLALLMRYGSLSVDMLILYAIVRLIIVLLTRSVIVYYAIHNFAECKLKVRFHKEYLRPVLSFSGWNLLGSYSVMLSGQGINVILNHFFGTVVNAARGLAFTVSNSVGIFVNNFTIAVVPQITKSYAKKDMDYMKKLIFYGSKLSFYIMLFFVLPLMIETSFILDIWLEEIPEHTVQFVRLSLVLSLIGMFDGILWQAQLATGKIKRNRILNSIFDILMLVLSYIALKTGFPPESVYVVSAFCALFKVAINVLILTKSLGFTLYEIMIRIFVPEFLVTSMSSVFPFVIYSFLPDSLHRFFLVLLTCVVMVMVSILYIGLTRQERMRVIKQVSSYIRIFRSRFLD